MENTPGLPTRVLVVDDDPAVGRLIKTLLESRGVQIELAVTTADAVRLAESAHYDAALVDLYLDDGRTAADFLAAVAGRPLARRVIVMSGYSRAAAAELIPSSTLRFLSKPFKSAELMELLEATMTDRRSS